MTIMAGSMATQTGLGVHPRATAESATGEWRYWGMAQAFETSKLCPSDTPPTGSYLILLK